MKISVNQKHIAAGVRCDNKRCAIALALSDAFRGIDFSVGVGLCSAWIKGKLRLFALPAPVVKWQRNFDYGQRCSPISFDLPITTNIPESEAHFPA